MMYFNAFFKDSMRINGQAKALKIAMEIEKAESPLGVFLEFFSLLYLSNKNQNLRRVSEYFTLMVID